MDSHVFIGPNFKDWLRNLTIVLNLEKLAYVLETPLPATVDPDASEEEQRAYAEWVDADLRVRSYMLTSMNSELQTRFENMQSAIRLKEGISPDDHVIKMSNKTGELQIIGTDLSHNVRILDSAATSHVCACLQHLQNSSALRRDEITLRLVDGT
ncbi:uncharacterized protein LOC123221426 [Mangifera indica]|uniref:uncharacterized protein LOC123221426 n=1 Tax=Mangifera indica TaxID=29780 RepID=UPI001CF941B6|nr:uncharacterized protein LOC123221426 [Mangifera indica]